MKCRKHRWSEELLRHEPRFKDRPGDINLLFPMHYRVPICMKCFKIKGVR